MDRLFKYLRLFICWAYFKAVRCTSVQVTIIWTEFSSAVYTTTPSSHHNRPDLSGVHSELHIRYHLVVSSLIATPSRLWHCHLWAALYKYTSLTPHDHQVTIPNPSLQLCSSNSWPRAKTQLTAADLTNWGGGGQYNGACRVRTPVPSTNRTKHTVAKTKQHEAENVSEIKEDHLLCTDVNHLNDEWRGPKWGCQVHLCGWLRAVYTSSSGFTLTPFSSSRRRHQIFSIQLRLRQSSGSCAFIDGRKQRDSQRHLWGRED